VLKRPFQPASANNRNAKAATVRTLKRHQSPLLILTTLLSDAAIFFRTAKLTHCLQDFCLTNKSNLVYCICTDDNLFQTFEVKPLYPKRMETKIPFPNRLANTASKPLRHGKRLH
jgi:hypothetical protein